jgi:molybdenum cofactor cytidylyltransferase
MNLIDGLIISAGYSSRMKDFKPLRLFNGIPFLLNIIIKISKVCRNIIIVTGFKANHLEAEINHWLKRQPVQNCLKSFNFNEQKWGKLRTQIRFCYNPQFNEGMFSSLQTGLKYLQNSNWILYHFVDQPHLPSKFYQDLVKRISEDVDWIQPVYNQKNAHPIIFNHIVAKKIINSDISQNLYELSNLNIFRKKLWKCQYPEVLTDFNSENDFIKSRTYE